MLKNLSKKRKKKGFTLIELVIVLAVLAIIALIAIPNFTKVKSNAVTQADEVNCKQIKGIVQLAVADGIIAPVDGTAYDLTIKVDNSKTDKTRITIGGTTPPPYGKDKNNTAYTSADLQKALIDVENPQAAGTDGYKVDINTDGKVIVVADDVTP